jgi:hypothetical protein
MLLLLPTLTSAAVATRHCALPAREMALPSPSSCSVDDGTLTRTMKPRRDAIMKASLHSLRKVVLMLGGQTTAAPAPAAALP